MSILWPVMPSVLGVFVGCLVCFCWKRTIRPIWAMATALYFVADALVLMHAPHVSGVELHWNWAGKLLSIVFSLVVLMLLRLSSAECGLKLPNTRNAWIWTFAGVAAAAVFAGVFNWAYRDGSHIRFETYLFQFTMPGLDEELSFRGVAFALLNRAFVDVQGRWQGVPAAIVTTLVFSLAHGWSIHAGHSEFVWVPLLYSAILGLLFAVTRLRSASLFGSVLAHNAANGFGTFLGSL